MNLFFVYILLALIFVCLFYIVVTIEHYEREIYRKKKKYDKPLTDEELRQSFLECEDCIFMRVVEIKEGLNCFYCDRAGCDKPCEYIKKENN